MENNIELFTDRTIINKLYESIYAEQAWEWIKGGMPISSVITSVQLIASKNGDNISLTDPTVRAFKSIMEKKEAEILANRINETGNASTGVTSDLIICELAISKGIDQLKRGELTMTMPILLQFMQFKKAILGDKYQGQSLWNLLDMSKQFEDLLDSVIAHCPSHIFDTILDDLKSKGWKEEVISDESRIKRKLTAELVRKDLQDIESMV